jgi:hypothetical protein
MFSIGLLVAIGSPADLKAQSCPQWTFETNSETLTGTSVSVFDISGNGTFVNLDTSESINTPGLLIQLQDSPYTLSSTTLPGYLSIDLMQGIKTLDNPATPYVNESDSWYFLSSPVFEVTFLNGEYFEATVEGEALRVNSSGAVYEDFILTIKGFLPDENGDEVLSYCSTDDPIRQACVDACWETYDDEDLACNTDPNPLVCSRIAFLKAVACAITCRFI